MRFQNWDQSIRRWSILFGSTCMRLHPIYNTGTKAIFMAFLRTYKMQLYYCVVSFTPKNTRNKIPPQITSEQIKLYDISVKTFILKVCNKQTVVEQVNFHGFFCQGSIYWTVSRQNKNWCSKQNFASLNLKTIIFCLLTYVFYGNGKKILTI